MSLSVGTRLGPYEITGSLGAGGMGEVYRAHDTELGREVALKVLPADFQADADRLARFQREAQVLASLNHPAIAAIHGLERSGGVPALVLELVEGETLADRLVHGPLPLDETVQIATQIADALEAAHDRDIVHRDLKPANVKIRPDGTVKVLDFGLAKAIEPEGVGRAPARGSSTMSPTVISPAMTQAGFILGTAAYMSPEQAKGRDVDGRADIWAFGCVVFEMLTGRRAFPGDDVTDTLAAVVLRDPDWNALPPGTPVGIRRLLTRCLRKDPKQRLRHIADARLDLEDRGETVLAAALHTATPARRWVPVLAVVFALLIGIVGVQTWRLSRASPVTPMPLRFSIPPPTGLEFSNDGAPLAVMSPDGSRIVLAYQRGTHDQLFTRRMDEDVAKPIAGTEEGARPFFSPDGKWIAFCARDILKKVAVDGGPPVVIGKSDFGTGVWTADDTIIFTPNYASGLWRIPAAGGAQEKLTEPTTADGELGHFWPQMLPDGVHVLFTSFRTPADTSRIEVYSLATKTRKVLVDGGFFGRYVASGHLLFTRGTTVMAIRFDQDRLATVGQPVPVVAGVTVDVANGIAQFSVSETGTLTFITEAAHKVPRQLAWLDRTGRLSLATDARRRFEHPMLSPDGRRVALTIRSENNADVWVHDLMRGTFERITSSPTSQFRPVWTPDGRRLFFVFEEPVFHIYSRSVDGNDEAVRIVDGPFDVVPQSVSPDGQFLVYERSDPSTRRGIWLLPLAAGATPRALIDTPFREEDGVVSPDGHRILYASDESGRMEVYLRAFPEGGGRVQISTDGGRNAIWSRDGKEIYFRDGDKMMVAAMAGDMVSRPSMLFEKRLMEGYDVARDGRFLAVVPDQNAPPAPVNIVVNWFEELKRLVPGD